MQKFSDFYAHAPLRRGDIETRQSDGAVLPALQSIALLIALVLVTHLSTFLCSTHVDKTQPFPALLLLPLKC